MRVPIDACLRHHVTPVGLEQSAGRLEYFRSAPNCRRAFCLCCGSLLLMDYDREDDVWLALGTLDDPEHVMPEQQLDELLPDLRDDI